jgi:tetratricopeptide (TPR) repeat protein
MLIDFAADPCQAGSRLSAFVVPRPVVWVSTRSRDGVGNVAQFSSFQMITEAPPTLMISAPMQENGALADTVRNIVETGEFVVNLVPYSLLDKIRETLPSDAQDAAEAGLHGLATQASQRVAPARVAGVPISFECRLASVQPYPGSAASCHLIFGEVSIAHIDDGVLDEYGQVDPRCLDAALHLGQDWYGRIDWQHDMRTQPAQAAGGSADVAIDDHALHEMFLRAYEHHCAGRLQQAASLYRTLLVLQPLHADAMSFLGLTEHQLGKHERAFQLVRQAIGIQPSNPMFYRNLGTVHKNTGNTDAAMAAYQKALTIEPRFPEALFDLGDCFRAQNRLAEAESVFRQAAVVKPDFAEAYVNLGVVQKDQSKFIESEASIRKALEIDPYSVNAHNNLGVLLQEQGKLVEAEASCRRAMQIAPNFALAHHNLGVTLREMARFAEAEECCRHVLAMEPEHAGAQFHLSFLKLLKGDFIPGWQKYEYRWLLPGHEPKPDLVEPQWRGVEDISGKTVLLYSEQGFGDTLQFSRYAKLVAARGATVIMIVPEPLKSLMARCEGVSFALTGAEYSQPGFDFQSPLLSLPLAFKTELATIPADIPYLSCDPELVRLWQARLGPKKALRVGLVWAGSARKHLPVAHAVDRMRSIHFDQMAPLLEIEGIEFLSLQLGEETSTQIDGNTKIRNFTGLIRDFHDTAALIENLDLVITVDTSVVHLAGALGKPVWMLNRFNTCWRWMLDRKDSPWYPSMRIFRQPKFGDWRSVMEEVEIALRELMASSALPDSYQQSLLPVNSAAQEESSASIVSRSAVSRSAMQIASDLQMAVGHHQAGHLQEAEVLYKSILAEQPRHADALHFLGMLAHQTGDNEVAVKLIIQAIDAAPGNPLFHYNLGTVYRHMDDLPSSIESYRRAIALKDNFADAHYKLGISFQHARQLANAEASYRRALALAPNLAGAHNNLGSVLRDAGRIGEAEASYRQALRIKPDFADAYLNLGNVYKDVRKYADAEINYRLALQINPNYAQAHSNLGVILVELGRFAEAEQCYRRALELQPDSVEIHTNLGFAMVEQHRFAEAETRFRHALQLSPDFPDAHNNLGIALREEGKLAESEASFRRALECNPRFAVAYNNLGNLLRDAHRLQEAGAAYRRALEINPMYYDAHVNYAMALLQAGDFLRGWKEYEYRWDGKNNESKRVFPQPMWQGEALQRKTILLHAEQGLGDTLQFVRYAKSLAERGATVYLLVPASLKALLASCGGVSAVYAHGELPPPFDFHCPIMSLPLAFKTELSSIPVAVPYLASTPSKLARWHERLGDRTALRVGLTWAGSARKDQPAAHFLDRQRSIHFDRLLPLLEVPGIQYFSLQLGDEARAQMNNNQNVLDYTGQLHDFEDTAALMENLDLIISVDTSVVHLAGALGKPVWLLNRYNSCWRWLVEREDSPWYPTLRIFGQPALGDWGSVIDQVKMALQQLVRDANSERAEVSITSSQAG